MALHVSPINLASNTAKSLWTCKIDKFIDTLSTTSLSERNFLKSYALVVSLFLIVTVDFILGEGRRGGWGGGTYSRWSLQDPTVILYYFVPWDWKSLISLWECYGFFNESIWQSTSIGWWLLLLTDRISTILRLAVHFFPLRLEEKFSQLTFFSKLTIRSCQCLQLTTNFFCHFTAEGQSHPDPPDTVVLLLNFSVAATRSISPDVNWYLKVAVVRNTQWTTKGVQVCVDTALIVSDANTTIHAEPGKHGHVRNSALVLDLYPQGVRKQFFFYFRLLYG